MCSQTASRSGFALLESIRHHLLGDEPVLEINNGINAHQGLSHIDNWSEPSSLSSPDSLLSEVDDESPKSKRRAYRFDSLCAARAIGFPDPSSNSGDEDAEDGYDVAGSGDERFTGDSTTAPVSRRGPITFFLQEQYRCCAVFITLSHAF
ncbi:hypothetical protein DKX38_020679 [Salix brachista]|uniref:Uncharacterized protein n=1 Tax=Salix brachista TaxID=2182728 RepID=A0A5N5K6I6_9ROSI|nr:hypothetical protein DKX38_020679 [Salix brachista]